MTQSWALQWKDLYQLYAWIAAWISIYCGSLLIWFKYILLVFPHIAKYFQCVLTMTNCAFIIKNKQIKILKASLKNIPPTQLITIISSQCVLIYNICFPFHGNLCLIWALVYISSSHSIMCYKKPLSYSVCVHDVLLQRSVIISVLLIKIRLGKLFAHYNIDIFGHINTSKIHQILL